MSDAPSAFAEQIALRLKELRQLRGWSLDTAAKNTGVSKAMLGQIERGESSPTIRTLWKIAGGFESSFSSFLYDDAGEKEAKKGDALMSFPDDPAMQIQTLFPYSSTTRMEVLAVTLLDKHEQQAAPHQPGVIEHVLVVEGTLELFFDGTWHVLPAGGKARFHADQPHIYRAVGERAVFHNIICYQQHDSSAE